MTKALSKLIRAAIVAVVLMAVAFGLALYRYPYTVRNVLSRVVPSVHVSYSGSDLSYLNLFNDKQDCQIKAAKKGGPFNKSGYRLGVGSVREGEE